MPAIPPASSFLAGSLLSLLMPVALLIALVVWYVLALRRAPGGDAVERRGPVDPMVQPPAATGEAEPSPSGGNS
jgi:hypothetical protein